MPKIFRFILGILPIVVLLLLLAPILGIFEQVQIFDSFYAYLNPKLGVNPFVATMVVIVLVFLSWKYSSYLFSFSSEKRRIVYTIGFGICFLFAFWNYIKSVSNIERICPNINTPFFVSSGEPVVFYYKHQNNKLEFFNHSGKHPQLGVELTPISTEIAEQTLEYIQNGQNDMFIDCRKATISTNVSNNFKRICPNSTDFVFFDGNGNARVNYHTRKDGKIELFESSLQFHPQLGVPLYNLTPAIAEKITTYISNGQSNFIFGCNLVTPLKTDKVEGQNTSINSSKLENLKEKPNTVLNKTNERTASNHVDIKEEQPKEIPTFSFKSDTVKRPVNKNIHAKSPLEDLSKELKKNN